MPQPLPLETVTVCVASEESPLVAARLDEYRVLLAPDEVQRADRFLNPADTARFILGRVLARTMLSRHSDVAPGDWPIAVDDRGRPYIAEPQSGGTDLRFNLSHTKGLVACAVTVGREIGIDVEWVHRPLTHDLPERFFSPDEVMDLRALPDADQHRAFFDYWTLKEAYIKARGLGLAVPLRHFTFHLHASRPPRVAFAPELDDDPESWQFAQYWPTSDHRMAVGVRRRGPDVLIDVSHAVPEVPA
jgi:4'-phosphopantetheinyl transferase